MQTFWRSKFWVLAFLFSLSACGGGGGDGSDDDSDNDNGDTPGVDLGLKLGEGDFWEYYWFNETSTFAQGSGTTSSTDFGIFEVTLDAPAPRGKGAQEVFPLVIDGDPGPYRPRWTHVKLDADGSLMGSTNGTDFKVIFDITTGEWNGGGFFHDFENDPVAIDQAMLEGEYNRVSALRLGYGDSSGGCETILGVTLCDDTSTTFSFYEYHKQGIGPVGFRQDTTYSSSGGNFFTSTTIRNTVELIETSEIAADKTEFSRPDWEEMAPLKTARDSHAAVALDGKIYVLGGFDKSNNSQSSMEIYDPSTNKWSYGPVIPTTTSGEALVISNKIYVESINANQVHIYDLTTGWSTVTVSNSGGQFGASDTYNDTTWGKLVAGVEGASVSISDRIMEVWAYQPSGNQWLSGTDLSIREWLRPSVTVVDDTMYVIGGFGHKSSCSFSSCDRGARDWVYKYDLLNDTWNTTSAAEMNTARDSLVTVSRNGKIIALGGNPVSCSDSSINPDCNIGAPMRSAESYNPSTNQWTDISSMLNPRKDFAAVVLGGDLYAIGGHDGSDETASVERYRP